MEVSDKDLDKIYSFVTRQFKELGLYKQFGIYNKSLFRENVSDIKRGNQFVDLLWRNFKTILKCRFTECAGLMASIMLLDLYNFDTLMKNALKIIPVSEMRETVMTEKRYIRCNLAKFDPHALGFPDDYVKKLIEIRNEH